MPAILASLARGTFGGGAARRSLGYLAELFRLPGWCTASEVLALHQRLSRSPRGQRWPDHIIGPGLALAAATTILVAMSLLGWVFLSATADGIAMFMLYGAGLVSGLLASIGTTLGAQTVQTLAHDIALALPFEGLYQAALHALGSNQTGIARVLANLGPFGSSHPGRVARAPTHEFGAL